MATVRNILVEALDRATLANRKQGAPADLMEAACKRFCGILQEYSDNELITAYRGTKDFDCTAEEMSLGGTDIPCGGSITNIVSMFYRSVGSVDWYPMTFVSLGSFYDAGNNDYCYSWQPQGANLFKVYFKPRFVAQHREMKVVYNEDIKLGIDDEVNLPHVYVELLTRAVAYKISIDKPRASDTKRNELKVELTELEEQIKANNADNRMLQRPTDGGRFFNNASMMSGSFVFGR